MCLCLAVIYITLWWATELHLNITLIIYFRHQYLDRCYVVKTIIT